MPAAAAAVSEQHQSVRVGDEAQIAGQSVRTEIDSDRFSRYVQIAHQTTPTLGPILEAGDARRFRAVRAAINRAIVLDAVPNHFALAVGARRRERMDGAFEGIEGLRFAAHRDGKRLIVLVAAHSALGHDSALVKSCEAGE
jgi:hypothetical protein